MITYTGRQVLPERGSPSLFDIGVGLSRIPRWTGCTKTWYNVLSHSFVVGNLLDHEIRVYGLLHDACECIVSDTPSPWKTDSQREYEKMLTRRIYRELNLRMPTREDRKKIKRADIAALHAEAYALGHPDPEGFCREDEIDERALLLTNMQLTRVPSNDITSPEICGRYFQDRVENSLTDVELENFYSAVLTPSISDGEIH